MSNGPRPSPAPAVLPPLVTMRNGAEVASRMSADVVLFALAVASDASAEAPTDTALALPLSPLDDVPLGRAEVLVPLVTDEVCQQLATLMAEMAAMHDSFSSSSRTSACASVSASAPAAAPLFEFEPLVGRAARSVSTSSRAQRQ